jgi:hypothetical protein
MDVLKFRPNPSKPEMIDEQNHETRTPLTGMEDVEDALRASEALHRVLSDLAEATRQTRQSPRS